MNDTNETIEPNYIFDDVPQVSPLITVSCCFAMSLVYVSSLYIWNNKHNRDHPATVKRRFLSVTVVMLITPVFVYKFSSQEILDKVPFNDLMGLRWQGLLMAIVVPYLLTMLLFLGPLCVELQNDTMKVFMGKFNKFPYRKMKYQKYACIIPQIQTFGRVRLEIYYGYGTT